MNSRRILIVDNHVDCAQSLTKLFRLDGHNVITVSDGETALVTARNFRPDLIVVAISLPGIDGYEVARRLRKSGCTAHLVSLIAFGQHQDTKLALEAGFDNQCSKPEDALELEEFFH